MMLAYQPVRSLATLKYCYPTRLAGAERVLPVIDDSPEIIDKENARELILKGEIKFENVRFNILKMRINFKFYKSKYPR